MELFFPQEIPIPSVGGVQNNIFWNCKLLKPLSQKNINSALIKPNVSLLPVIFFFQSNKAVPVNTG